MTAIIDVTRLAKVCALFSSDHAGERAAAAWRANEIVKNAGLTWDDVLHSITPQPEQVQRSTSAASANEILADYYEYLSDWEVEFLSSIAHRRQSLTPRQRHFLNKIKTKFAGTSR